MGRTEGGEARRAGGSAKDSWQNRRVLACATLAVALPLALLTGCGNSRMPMPTITAAAAPHGFRLVRYPASGVTLRAPRDWDVAPQRAPMVTIISSGAAVVALWRFPWTGSSPSRGAALARTRTALINAVRARDRSLQVIRSRLSSVTGSPAIELDAIEQIHGQTRRVRSLHVFVPGAEIVLEEYAPPSAFHAVDHAVFSPLKRSLQLFRAPGA
jgi:hypothetical protein